MTFSPLSRTPLSRTNSAQTTLADAARPSSGSLLRSALGYPDAPHDVAVEDDMSSFALRVTCDIDDPALIADWRQLEADGRASVFQSRAWQAGLIRHVLRPADVEPIFVSVSDPTTHRPLALFPLQIARKTGLTVIDYLGPDFCDTAMPLMARGFAPDASTSETLLKALIVALPPADILHLAKMPQNFHGTPNPFVALSGSHGSPDMTFPVALAVGAEDFVGATSAYKAYQKQWRKLTRRDGIAFEIFTDPDRIAAAFDAMIAMRNARFDALDRDDLLDDPKVAAFYRDMALAPAVSRVVSLAGLKVGDAYTAYIYMMDNGKKLSTVISAIDNTVGNAYAPGLILFTKIFERAIEAGYDVADIGIGYMHYKTRFAPRPSPLIVLERGLTLKGRLFVAAQGTKRGLKALARESALMRMIAEKVLRRKIGGVTAPAPKASVSEEE